ncbi:MAG: glutamine synthetase family protein [Proteobacteria bacterium]|nr:glutamine synthetase family protein [Pseudomonadota bacterium]MDA1341285.1 glutamine synthetase family protein [Pseudomonadota bacterium]
MVSDTKLDQFLQDNPDIEIFEIILHDLNGNQRGKWLPRSQIAKVFDGGFKMPLSACSLDCWGRDQDELGQETGDTDGICEAHPETLARVPWADKPTAQIIVSMGNEAGDGPFGGDCRSVLQSVLDRYAALGLTPVVASEIEFHLLTLDRDQFGQPQHTQRALDGSSALGGQTYGLDTMRDTAPLMDAITDAAKLQNLPIDTLITEFGPSQFEINLCHQDSAMRACDQGSMLKRAIRSVARQHDKIASFMAKPFAREVGNGMHIHFSLLDEQGNNVFDNGTEEGSDLLRQAVAGCVDTMADSMAILAPNINSFRRMTPGCFAPLSANWGYENRTTAIRIPGGDYRAMRIEHRVAGADANPYLVVAAILAGALSGIERKLSAPEPVVGDACDVKPTLPHFWNDAIDVFEESSFIGEYLGAELQRNFTLCKRNEKYEFDTRVTALEYDAFL